MNQETVSVITVNRNNAQGLRATLRSVGDQKARGAAIQSIVIDGDSNDNSKAVMDEFVETIDIAVSEPDAGVYDAMNKGVRLATGDSILFLNSGDRFFALFDLRGFCIRFEPSNYVVMCRCIQTYQQDAYIRPSLHQDRPAVARYSHQAIFVPKSVYQKLVFDLRFAISADTRWKLEVASLGNVIHTREICSVFELGGLSNFPSYNQARLLFHQPRGLWPGIKALMKIFLRRAVGLRTLYRMAAFGKYDYVRTNVLLTLEKYGDRS